MRTIFSDFSVEGSLTLPYLGPPILALHSVYRAFTNSEDIACNEEWSSWNAFFVEVLDSVKRFSVSSWKSVYREEPSILPRVPYKQSRVLSLVANHWQS